jgi:hypothetical protein
MEMSKIESQEMDEVVMVQVENWLERQLNLASTGLVESEDAQVGYQQFGLHTDTRIVMLYAC